MKRSSGFTLTEVLIAASILSVFMIGVFNIYRSGSESFRRGSWRQKAQKDAQLFLEEARLYVERAGNALTTRDDRIDVMAFPLRLNSVASGTAYDVRSLGADTTLLFSNMLTPCTLYSNLASTKQAGRWVGGLFTANRRTLRLRTSINPADLPPAVMPWVPALGTDFLAAPSSQLRQTQILEEVESVMFNLASMTEGIQLTITVTLSRTGVASGTNDTRVTQSIRAKLLQDVGVQWF